MSYWGEPTTTLVEDPGRPWAAPASAPHPGDTERDIARILDALEERSAAAPDLRNDEAEKRADYKIALAKALVGIKEELSTVPVRERPAAGEREAMALLRCEQEFRAWLIAEAAKDACLERQRDLRVEMSGATSLNASARLLGGGS